MYKRQPNTAKLDPGPLKREIFTIKCVSGSSDQLKLAIFTQKHDLKLLQKSLILADFGQFFQLWGQF